MKNPSSKSSMQAGFTLVELMVAVAIISILAAAAMVRFTNFTARTKQSEAKVNLKAMYDAERTYFADKQAFTADLTKAGFLVTRGNRYAYYIELPATKAQPRTTAVLSARGPFDAIAADTFAHKEISTQPTEFGTDGTLTWAAASNGFSNIPSGTASGVATGWFVGRAFGNISSKSNGTYDAWFVATSNATVTSTCTASNHAIVSAGVPGNTYDQTTCL